MGAVRKDRLAGWRLLRAAGAALLLAVPLPAAEPVQRQGPNGTPQVPADSWIDSDWGTSPECEPAVAVRPGWLAQSLPSFRHRHGDLGQPLRSTSWLNRPNYVGWFLGETFGGTLADDLDLEPSLFTGLWLGHDFSHYWGAEIRFGLNYGDITYQPDGYVATDSRNAMADVNVLYYPWGDARWRPYASLGAGIAGFHFTNEFGYPVDHTAFVLPLGLGAKYLCGNRWAIRLDVKDNVTLGGHGLNTLGNWSVIAGFEFHWGQGSASDYYPW